MDQQIGFALGIALRDFKEDGFSGERHSLKAPQSSSPQLACQEFHRGANRYKDGLKGYKLWNPETRKVVYN